MALEVRGRDHITQAPTNLAFPPPRNTTVETQMKLLTGSQAYLFPEGTDNGVC